ncbi:orotidine-5'-phosphate decarboxylase [Schaalia sp. lx-260]|uniref:orotidine-5'-phosphate decarboxylase n=1 Tax=Schaalia sp. lx-260 TaxID=2899082 RepID=UPI001E2A635E|nr:orotidine-5'-phosphate decarboxylase [Schaalia sp. lx-260]MCD4549551.1 orotidine-5'-phosphate decarboxylase [Schaalia sp. lx-260]
MGISFGDRLYEAMGLYGPVCVGIDPHPALLRDWGLSCSAQGVRDFGLRLIDALGGHVAAVKPQVAFFEEYGSAGVAALEEVIAACRATGTLCIVDAKRGDIGSTMMGYARAFLSDDSALAGDAVTLSPYVGVGALMPALEMAGQSGRGVFVLGLTSNPEGMSIQHCRDEGGESVAAKVMSEVSRKNMDYEFNHSGPFGVVVGATVGSALRQFLVNSSDFSGIFLAPGVGAQGAGSAEVRAVFGKMIDRVLISTSRAVLSAGPSKEALCEAYEKTRSSLSL